jgi:hypothetical protein
MMLCSALATSVPSGRPTPDQLNCSAVCAAPSPGPGGPPGAGVPLAGAAVLAVGALATSGVVAYAWAVSGSSGGSKRVPAVLRPGAAGGGLGFGVRAAVIVYIVGAFV